MSEVMEYPTLEVIKNRLGKHVTELTSIADIAFR